MVPCSVTNTVSVTQLSDPVGFVGLLQWPTVSIRASHLQSAPCEKKPGVPWSLLRGSSPGSAAGSIVWQQALLCVARESSHLLLVISRGELWSILSRPELSWPLLAPRLWVPATAPRASCTAGFTRSRWAGRSIWAPSSGDDDFSDLSGGCQRPQGPQSNPLKLIEVEVLGCLAFQEKGASRCE